MLDGAHFVVYLVTAMTALQSHTGGKEQSQYERKRAQEVGMSKAQKTSGPAPIHVKPRSYRPGQAEPEDARPDRKTTRFRVAQ